MATYDEVTILKKGSSGDDVKYLQTALKNNGYDLDADGIYGSKTQAAVRDYQSKNNLQVDGIAGREVRDSLAGLNNGGNTGSVGYLDAQYTAGGGSGGFSFGGRPDFNSRYETQIQSLLNQILNRGDFAYDFNADPLYQQMRDVYTQQGKMAMMDAMGNAAALSGGFGNSYGQSVGQQTYNAYLQELNNSIPALRDAAYNMWLNEGDIMNQNLTTLRGLDDTDYGRYRDSVGDWYADRDFAYQQYLMALEQAAAQAATGGRSSGGGGGSSDETGNEQYTIPETVDLLQQLAKSDGIENSLYTASMLRDYGIDSGFVNGTQDDMNQAMNNFTYWAGIDNGGLPSLTPSERDAAKKAGLEAAEKKKKRDNLISTRGVIG